MISTRARSCLGFLLLLIGSAPALGQPLSETTEKVLESVTQEIVAKEEAVLDLSAKEFYEEIEHEARSFYDLNKVHFPDIKRTAWDRMVRVSTLRFESMGLGAKAMARYAKPAAGTFLVTNIVSTFILPPILTAMGQPGLALLVIATPFEPVVAAGQVFIMKSWQDILLIRNIGFSEYTQIRKMRKELLGMSERAHVISLIQEDLMREMQGLSINVTTDVVSRGRNVSVRELEQIVSKDPLGRQWIDTLVPLQNKKSLYSLELWIYIQERTELRSELLQNLKERMALDAGDSAHQKISTQLHELLDLKKTLLNLDDQLTRTIKNSSKPLSMAEKKGLKALNAETSDYASQVRRLSELAETHSIWQMIHGDRSLVDLSSSIGLLRDTIRSYRAALPVAGVLDSDRLATETALREILRIQKKRSPSLKNECGEALTKLIRWGRYKF